MQRRLCITCTAVHTVFPLRPNTCTEISRDCQRKGTCNNCFGDAYLRVNYGEYGVRIDLVTNALRTCHDGQDISMDKCIKGG